MPGPRQRRRVSGRRTLLKAALWTAIGVALLVARAERDGWRLPGIFSGGGGETAVERLFDERRSDVFVELEGEVDRVLADDLEGSRHQRFIVELASGHTVLVAHNIDLAPRVPVARGDRVAVRGEYEWNERGGVVHWTHHDPQGRRPGGWVRHRDRDYR